MTGLPFLTSSRNRTSGERSSQRAPEHSLQLLPGGADQMPVILPAQAVRRSRSLILALPALLIIAALAAGHVLSRMGHESIGGLLFVALVALAADRLIRRGGTGDRTTGN